MIKFKKILDQLRDFSLELYTQRSKLLFKVNQFSWNDNNDETFIQQPKNKDELVRKYIVKNHNTQSSESQEFYQLLIDDEPLKTLLQVKQKQNENIHENSFQDLVRQELNERANLQLKQKLIKHTNDILDQFNQNDDFIIETSKYEDIQSQNEQLATRARQEKSNPKPIQNENYMRGIKSQQHDVDTLKKCVHYHKNYTDQILQNKKIDFKKQEKKTKFLLINEYEKNEKVEQRYRNINQVVDLIEKNISRENSTIQVDKNKPNSLDQFYERNIAPYLGNRNKFKQNIINNKSQSPQNNVKKIIYKNTSFQRLGSDTKNGSPNLLQNLHKQPPEKKTNSQKNEIMDIVISKLNSSDTQIVTFQLQDGYRNQGSPQLQRPQSGKLYSPTTHTVQRPWSGNIKLIQRPNSGKNIRPESGKTNPSLADLSTKNSDVKSDFSPSNRSKPIKIHPGQAQGAFQVQSLDLNKFYQNKFANNIFKAIKSPEKKSPNQIKKKTSFLDI